MPFLPPNQQRQSTEGTTKTITSDINTEKSPYIIGLSVDGVDLVRPVTERLRETEVSVHVKACQLLNVGRAAGTDEVRQCRRDLFQLVDDHSLVCQLTHLHLVTPPHHHRM